MKIYDNNTEYIEDMILKLNKEFKNFGTVDGNQLITIIALAKEENEEILDTVLNFTKNIFIQIVQQNCKIHNILRSSYFDLSKGDKTSYHEIYGYNLPHSLPSITEFYKTNNATDTSYIDNIIRRMKEDNNQHDSND